MGCWTRMFDDRTTRVMAASAIRKSRRSRAVMILLPGVQGAPAGDAKAAKLVGSTQNGRLLGRPRCSFARNPKDQPAAASFLAISRLMVRAPIDSSSALALARKASRPPRCSTERSALAETRRRTERLSVSETSVTLQRFGRNFRFVLRFEWLTRWPLSTALPVSSQRRDMGSILLSLKGRGFDSRVCLDADPAPPDTRSPWKVRGYRPKPGPASRIARRRTPFFCNMTVTI